MVARFLIKGLCPCSLIRFSLHLKALSWSMFSVDFSREPYSKRGVWRPSFSPILVTPGMLSSGLITHQRLEVNELFWWYPSFPLVGWGKLQTRLRLWKFHHLVISSVSWTPLSPLTMVTSSNSLYFLKYLRPRFRWCSSGLVLSQIVVVNACTAKHSDKSNFVSLRLIRKRP